MATAQQVQALITSHMAGDNDRFVRTAKQIEAHARSHGHFMIAGQISQAVARPHPRQGQGQQPMTWRPGQATELKGLLSVVEPNIKLDDMVLASKTRSKLDRVLLEHRSSEKLAQHNLRPKRKLLLVGPPGGGKTMTAAAISSELGIPMFSVLLGEVFKSHLGETGAGIAKIFEHIRNHLGVYLFDEFDALGTERSVAGGGESAGEIRRVLNSILQMLEQDDSNSIIVAATNHDAILDGALFRRFDDVIHYPLPTLKLRLELIERVIAKTGIGLPEDVRSAALGADGLSQSEIESACLDAAKEAVLGDIVTVPDGTLHRLFQGRERKSLEPTPAEPTPTGSYFADHLKTCNCVHCKAARLLEERGFR